MCEFTYGYTCSYIYTDTHRISFVWQHQAMPRPPWLEHSYQRSAAKGWLRKRPASPRAIWRWKPVCSTYIISFRISVFLFFFWGGWSCWWWKRWFLRKAAWIFCNFKMLKCTVSDIPWPDVTHRGDWAILFIWHLKRSMLRQRFQRSKWSHLRTEANFGSCIGLGIRTWTCHWERTTWSFMNIVT